MPDHNGLLAHFVPYLNLGQEDVATEVLASILNRSHAARRAFADFLRAGDADPPAIARSRTQYHLPSGAYPDMACLEDGDKVLALVESKFWASLTDPQPVKYWEALPPNAPATLLFVAPPDRVNQGSLWGDLVQRLRNEGYQLGETRQEQNLISAPEQGAENPRRLMLCSWDLLLNHLAQAALASRDWQASFEIAELRGLAAGVIAGTAPQRDENIKTLISSAINRLEQSGWANTDHFGQGGALPNAEGHYLHFAEAFAWFGISYDERRRSNRPLWLVFRDSIGVPSRLKVSADQVRHRLADLESADLPGSRGAFCVPIDWPQGDSTDTMLDALVEQLEDIAGKIASAGPPYRKDVS